ncbi:MAG: hypothetical protein A2Y18_06735 [Clostridiales bacterium GWD2_32_19]|nr:MAG: hypothetical protein A2Y18_06735 [Clostridiales bacterium GWD2_32_19]
MIKRITELTNVFPKADLDYGYWHIHLPASQGFIDSYKTPASVRKKCIQTLIDRVKFLIDIKPESDIPIRVVACITLPYLWDSQVIVFFGDDYYRNFFNRNNEFQKWTLLSEVYILNDWKVYSPCDLAIKGYKEEIIYEDYKSTSELWFIGDVN